MGTKVKRKYMNKLLKHQLANLQIKVQLRKMILLMILTKIPMRKLRKSRKLKKSRKPRKTSKLRKSNKKKLQKKISRPKNRINSMYGEDEDTDEEIEKMRAKQETDIKQE